MSQNLTALFILSFFVSPVLYAETVPRPGDICHVEADYYYPGRWEPYSNTELICNYWIFLDDDIHSEESPDAIENSFYDYDEIDIFDELQEMEE